MPSIGPKGTPIIYTRTGSMYICIYGISPCTIYQKTSTTNKSYNYIYTILVMLQLSLILEWHYIMHVPYYYMHVFYMGIQIQTIKFDFMATELII